MEPETLHWHVLHRVGAKVEDPKVIPDAAGRATNRLLFKDHTFAQDSLAKGSVPDGEPDNPWPEARSDAGSSDTDADRRWARARRRGTQVKVEVELIQGSWKNQASKKTHGNQGAFGASLTPTIGLSGSALATNPSDRPSRTRCGRLP